MQRGRYTGGMMHRRSWILTSIAGSSLLGQNKPAEEEKKLSADELKELVDKKDIFFLDVREPKELEELGTIKGYVNIPLDQLEKRIAEVPKNKLIVTA
jgi:predicted sulfurtransferase